MVPKRCCPLSDLRWNHICLLADTYRCKDYKCCRSMPGNCSIFPLKNGGKISLSENSFSYALIKSGKSHRVFVPNTIWHFLTIWSTSRHSFILHIDKVHWLFITLIKYPIMRAFGNTAEKRMSSSDSQWMNNVL